MGNAPSIYEFRQGIVDLQSNHVRPDDEFWKQIFLANLNLKELHTLYQATDVRRLILEQPKNLNSLIRKAMDQIAAYIKYHKEITDTRSVHNAISILTRTIPVVLEAEHRSFANSFFLLNIYETQCEKELDSFSNGGDVAQMGAKRDLKGTIAHLYAELVLKLFFIPNFTLSGVDEAHASTALWYSPGDFARVSVVQDDETHVPNEGKSIPLMHTWERFTRVSNTRPNSHIQSNRSEVLTLLLVSLSGTLFQDDHEALTHTDILQDAFRSEDQLIRSLREQLILSLIGVIRATDCHTASSWNILSSGAKPILLEPSVHVLLALLRYDDDELEESECENEEKKSCQSSSVWRLLQEIPTFVLEDVVCHIGALLRFSYVEASSSGWSSRAPPSLTCYRELIVLVWKLFDGIRPILVPVCRSARFQDLFLSLIHIVLSVRRDAARYGDVQMCSLILVLLSGEREFSVALSTVPLPTSVRLDVSSNVTFENGSTLTDALCLAVYTLVTSSPSTPWLTGLVDAWITTLSNISPYIKRLTMVAAQKIIVLFEAFSQTRYFTKDANSFFRLCMLLETLANVVQYQYDGGISLVYALLSTPDGLSRVYNYVSLYCQESVETESKLARDTEDSANAIPPTGASECNDELKLLWNPHLQGALDTLRRLTHELTKDMSTRSLSTDTDVVQYLSSTTPVGIIPVPHPILIRRFRAQLHTYQWVTTWTWTLIYHKYLYYFDANTVRLLSLVVNEGQSGTSLALDQGKDVKSVPFKEKETPRY